MYTKWSEWYSWTWMYVELPQAGFMFHLESAFAVFSYWIIFRFFSIYISDGNNECEWTGAVRLYTIHCVGVRDNKVKPTFLSHRQTIRRNHFKNLWHMERIQLFLSIRRHHSKIDDRKQKHWKSISTKKKKKHLHIIFHTPKHSHEQNKKAVDY